MRLDYLFSEDNDFLELRIVDAVLYDTEDIDKIIADAVSKIITRCTTGHIGIGFSVTHDIDSLYKYVYIPNDEDSVHHEVKTYFDFVLDCFAVVKGKTNGFVIGVDFYQNFLYISNSELNKADSLQELFDTKICSLLKESSTYTTKWCEGYEDYLVLRAYDGKEFRNSISSANSILYLCKRLFANMCLYLGVDRDKVFEFLLNRCSFEDDYYNSEQLQLLLEVHNPDLFGREISCMVNRIEPEHRTIKTIAKALLSTVSSYNNHIKDYENTRCTLSLSKISENTSEILCNKIDTEFNNESIHEALKQMFKDSHYCIYDDTEDDDDDLYNPFMSAIRQMSGN